MPLRRHLTGPTINRAAEGVKFLMCTLETVLLRGRRCPPQARSPATLTQFVRVDEVLRGLAASGTFQRHQPRHSANVQAVCTGALLNPLAEFCRQIPLVQRARFLTCMEKWPGTKQRHHACRYYDRHEQ